MNPSQLVEGSNPPWLTDLNCALSGARALSPNHDTLQSVHSLLDGRPNGMAVLFSKEGNMMATPGTATTKRRMPQTEDYMTVAEVAAKLSLHPVTIRRLIKAERLKAIKVGYATMISKESVTEYQARTNGLENFDPRRGQ